MQFFNNTNFALIDKRKMGYIVSATLLIISIGSLILHGGPKLNIDFTGGSLLHLQFEKNVEIQEFRDLLASRNLKGEIKHFGAENEISIRMSTEHIKEDIASLLSADINAAIPDNPFEILRNETVGPKIGVELLLDALYAIFVAMLLILLYVIVRFEFKFSIGAIAALAHDVIITLGIFSVFEIEISAPIIAAVLTIVGYSLNDTIVVFDRVRENLKAASKNIKDITDLVNKSLNETLSRTVVTSLTTLIVVVVLYFLGGEVLKTFAFALIIGVLIGTYSSIFVASPIVVDWKTKKA
ncbi:MAG: protein translocase subunit SecF [Calditrichaeota bacterium]|nr:MAG: protein translocase subunit SecF [Calditrichota bacterium]MBL1204211.1 protein translocase subunit SecF [Calditrichota bacterium]NOG44041.1 protein translocase subunit SecF [Calditrichota bacterium]